MAVTRPVLLQPKGSHSRRKVTWDARENPKRKNWNSFWSRLSGWTKLRVAAFVMTQAKQLQSLWKPQLLSTEKKPSWAFRLKWDPLTAKGKNFVWIEFIIATYKKKMPVRLDSHTSKIKVHHNWKKGSLMRAWPPTVYVTNNFQTAAATMFSGKALLQLRLDPAWARKIKQIVTR